MVIIAADRLPNDDLFAEADLDEMCERFQGWYPTFRLLLRLASETTAWKLRSSMEMESWRHPNNTLLYSEMPAMLPFRICEWAVKLRTSHI